MRTSRNLRFIAVASFFLIARNGPAQDPKGLIRVEGAVGTYELDGITGISGEYHELSNGKHAVRIISDIYGSSLTIDLLLSAGAASVGSTELRENCISFGDGPSFTVDRWPVELVADPRVEGAHVLLIHGPHFVSRSDQVQLCPLPCCGWDRQSNWSLDVTSKPVGAAIFANGKYVASTDKTLSLPYGITRYGYQEEVIIRVMRPASIGCAYRLSELRQTLTKKVDCTLRAPGSSGQPPH